MNERIQELEKQAWEFVDKTWDWTNPDNPSKTTLFKTKFAELIVQECAELIDNKVMITAAQTYDDVFVAVYDTNFANAKRIREHFGVEE